MDGLAQGDLSVEVSGTVRSDEIGAMARSVEVFRENALKISSMTDEERAASERRRIERTAMMQQLQLSFGEVVDAAVDGDFTKRVQANFDDAELNKLAASVNNLVDTVDRGLSETGDVLAALAEPGPDGSHDRRASRRLRAAQGRHQRRHRLAQSVRRRPQAHVQLAADRNP